MSRPGRLALLALMVSSACQPGPASAPSPTDVADSVTTTTLPATVTTVGAAEGVGLFRDCMARRGLDIGPIPLDAQGRPRLDLALRGIDLSSSTVTDALGRCSEHLITGALSLEGSPAIREEMIAMLTRFSGCIRSRGVPAFPDPVPGFHGVGFPYPVEEIPYDDPDLAVAIDVCRERMANRRGAGR